MTVLPDKINRMIRVNQAGEYGAGRIYAGQLAILKGKPAEKALTEMAAQETEHLQKFNRLLIDHQVRPTILQPLWHVGGYVLGMVTALMGEKAAHACTIAVEEVIDGHYQSQLGQLHAEDPAFKDKREPELLDQTAGLMTAPGQDGSLNMATRHLADLIEQCRQDEVAHKETAIQLGGMETKGYRLLTGAIKAVSRTAIWLSSRI